MVRRPLVLAALTTLACLSGCSPAESASNSTGGVSSGGASAQGGASTGGVPGTAGTTSNAGTANTGGISETSGGSIGKGGGPNSGNTGTSGGSLGNGGTSPGTGGNPNTAGSSSAGGTGNGGGALAKGGSSNGGAAGQASGGAAAAGSGGATGTAAVRIVGRTAGTRFSWPGVNINARFSGSQVSLDLNDGSNKNRFTVVIDGGTPKTVTTAAGQTSLSLATGLANGTHDLVIWRNTEAAMGVSTFAGLSNFGSGGALLAPAAAPDRRIEVIGDSISAGAGIEGTSTTCSPNIDAFSNNYLAYGSVAARSVQADVVTIAWSGIGVYRSYSASDPTMPARYDHSIPNDNSAWEFSNYQPHVVVVNLGTNDFGPGNPGPPYVDAYVNFAKHVRSKYASANLILIDMYGGERVTAINSVVSALKNGGDSKVEMLSFNSVPSKNTACNDHPNVTAQKAMGDLLAARLKTLMSW